MIRNTPDNRRAADEAWALMTQPVDPMPAYAVLDWVRERTGIEDINEIYRRLVYRLAARWFDWYRNSIPESTRGLLHVTYPITVKCLRSRPPQLTRTRERVTRMTASVARFQNRIERPAFVEWTARLAGAARELDLCFELELLTRAK